MTSDEDTARFEFLRGTSAADRFACANVARAFGRRVGLGAKRAEELAIATSELGSNVIRHADHGTIELHLVEAPRRHVLLVCRDRGPGIAEPARALRDGVSGGRELAPDARRSEGLGLGLGAVERLVDELHVQSVVDLGTTVTARKWIP